MIHFSPEYWMPKFKFPWRRKKKSIKNCNNKEKKQQQTLQWHGLLYLQFYELCLSFYQIWMSEIFNLTMVKSALEISFLNCQCNPVQEIVTSKQFRTSTFNHIKILLKEGGIQTLHLLYMSPRLHHLFRIKYRHWNFRKHSQKGNFDIFL